MVFIVTLGLYGLDVESSSNAEVLPAKPIDPI